MSLPATVQTLGRRACRFWHDEASLRARLISIGHLITGNMMGSMVGLLAFVVTARALGPHDFGILALTLSYARSVQLLIAFQIWQPLIKYGAEVRGKEDGGAYRALMKFGLLIDLSAALTAYVTAVGFALVFGPLVGVSQSGIQQVFIYSTVLLFQIEGFPTAVLRLAGRFRLVAYSSLISTTLRLALCTAGLLAGADLVYFVVAWAVSQVTGSLIFLTLALIELRRQGVRRLLMAPLAGVTRRFKGLWAFTLGSKVELMVRSSTTEFDTLLVGALAGAPAAGLYHVAKRLGRLVLHMGVQVQAVVYPDIARLWAQQAVSEFRRIILQTEILLLALGVAVFAAVALWVGPVLSWTAGPEFEAAAPLIVVQMIAVAMMLSGSAVRSALLAMGCQPVVLRIVIVSTLVFYAVALATIPVLGAMGANIAHTIMAGLWLAGLLVAFHREIRSHSSTLPPDTPDPTPPVEEPARP
ncbi:lipopolysaccharide biosynthesis protein [Chelativorans salis]|uniref:Oligosaccharide flippase family protein n=1 Tax=Chelativorans salis TaxID=2978478 RepID=A0ABT2LSU7_9HYPH|nr:oligosaccharide flippase family protein [Chelativorans sp. EGI FJ00035]MCT7376917.1 oligosaccharide flippase family protein [Chelativorans sp. EGI FJ00035]